MNICPICGKKPIKGNSRSTRGLPKKSGGIGLKCTGITRRVFKPNLQKIRVKLASGQVRRLKICTSCIQAGLITKAV